MRLSSGRYADTARDGYASGNKHPQSNFRFDESDANWRGDIDTGILNRSDTREMICSTMICGVHSIDVLSAGQFQAMKRLSRCVFGAAILMLFARCAGGCMFWAKEYRRDGRSLLC